jgi:hypothetical protein
VDRGNWVAVDKEAVRYLPKKRPCTELEAVFSLTVDIDHAMYTYTKAGKGSGKIPRTPDEAINLVMDHGQSIAGYSALWGWSRCKVRNFLKKLRQDLDSNKTPTRHPIRLIIKKLPDNIDSNKTGVRQALDTTNNPQSLILKNEKEKKDTTSKKHTSTKKDLPDREEDKKKPSSQENPISYHDNNKPSQPSSTGDKTLTPKDLFSFESFLKKYPQGKTQVIKDSIAAIKYFLKAYQETFCRENKPLSPGEWQNIIETILYKNSHNRDPENSDYDFHHIRGMTVQYLSMARVDNGIQDFNTVKNSIYEKMQEF